MKHRLSKDKNPQFIITPHRRTKAHAGPVRSLEDSSEPQHIAVTYFERAY
jgi:hypothetical protein